MAVCLGAAVVTALGLVSAAGAEDAYYIVPPADLKITEGKLPGSEPSTPSRSPQAWRLRDAMVPYAVLDGEGEAYVGLSSSAFDPWARQDNAESQAQRSLAVRAPAGKDVTGRLYLPNADWKGMQMVRFRVPAASPKSESERKQNFHDFYQAKVAHYERLVNREIPGTAWFRHQLREANTELGQATDQPQTQPRVRGIGRAGGRGEIAETYDLFTGGRALSENLQLDRDIFTRAGSDELVDINGLPGIDVREFDWKPLVKDLKPAIDPLASKIPADQHAVFFPSITAAVGVAEQMGEQGTVFLSLADPRSQDTGIVRSYQRQLGIPLSELAKQFGPLLIKSVAVTGSDPYYATGTDVAIILETANPAALENALLLLRRPNVLGAVEVPAAKVGIDGVSFQGFTTPDRRISSYIARIGGAVVLTNSLEQLKRLIAVDHGKAPSVASLEEFKFFRNRYRLGDAEETALVFVSDPTIRRWCGPRWRIAGSRRTRDAAVLAEVQAQHLDRLVSGGVKPEPVETKLALSLDGKLTLEPRGIVSSSAGTLTFLTPIVELSMEKVTKAEADAYRFWRDGYQRNWRWAFDPIGLRLSLRPGRTAVDLTVLPLIAGTDYRRFISLAEGVQLKPLAGDLHDAPLHFILAINKKSEVFRQAEGLMAFFSQGNLANLGNWIGESVSLYADPSPFWDELAKVPDDKKDAFLREQGYRFPVALNVEVANGMRLTMFLAAARAYIDQAAPGMTVWETLKHKDEPYVKITPSERARRGQRDAEKLAVYYTAAGDSLVVTLNEDVLKAAIDRQLAQRVAEKEGKKVAQPARPWLGDSLNLQVDRRTVDVAVQLGKDQLQATMQLQAWGNLPILNEWKRRYPKEDPMKLHERFWQTRLMCPGGGSYVWNDQWQTYESSVYGHPGQPKAGPAVPPAVGGFRSANFGLTFENQGLRTRVVLEHGETK